MGQSEVGPVLESVTGWCWEAGSLQACVDQSLDVDALIRAHLELRQLSAPEAIP